MTLTRHAAHAAPALSGAQVGAQWPVRSPTGDRRACTLRHRAFVRTSPPDRSGKDGSGAVAPGLRCDIPGLTADAVDGAKQKGLTPRSMWRSLAFLKFRADDSRPDIERPSSPPAGEADIITLRVPIAW